MRLYKVLLVTFLLFITQARVTEAQQSNDQVPTQSGSTTSGAEENYQFASEAQRQVFLSLTAELRCPMCQNQNIADSDAMISHDMRRKVFQLLQEGKTEQEVIDFMKARYGDFVHYKPPVTPYTMWLWLIPVLFAVFALIKITRAPKSFEVEDLDSKLAQADELLKREE